VRPDHRQVIDDQLAGWLGGLVRDFGFETETPGAAGSSVIMDVQ
jgi:hypothetical protein